MSAVITGTATYRERIALPPGAVFEVTLEDVSRADAPAEILGRQRREAPGNPPFAIEIEYDASRVEPGHRYSVRARVVVGGALLFTTDSHVPVLTGGHGDTVEIILRRAGVFTAHRPSRPDVGEHVLEADDARRCLDRAGGVPA